MFLKPVFFVAPLKLEVKVQEIYHFPVSCKKSSNASTMAPMLGLTARETTRKGGASGKLQSTAH